MRPITGTGKLRSAVASAVKRAALPARGGRRDGDAGAGHRLERQRAGADLAVAGDALHLIAQCRAVAASSGATRAGERLDLGSRPRQQADGRQALGQPVGIAIELERRFQRRHADLVDPQRALHRVAVDLRQQVLAADDEAGLRPAQQLVAGEGDEVGAVGDGLGDRRLVLEAEAREVDQRAGAEIVDQRHALLARKRRKVARPELPR